MKRAEPQRAEPQRAEPQRATETPLVQQEVQESHYTLPTQSTGSYSKFSNNFNIKPRGWGSGENLLFTFIIDF